VKTIEIKADSNLQRGCVVFVSNGVAKPVRPQDIVSAAGMIARDVKEGETVFYNPLRNTEDIIVYGGLRRK